MGRILIADDHDALRRGLARALTEAKHEVEEASNGNAAIERLHESYFDVVLSDLKMGGSDGIDVLRTTRALHPTTSVILMTAFASVNTAVEAMKIGAFDYVQKPFEIEEMEVKIEKALEVKRLKHELEYLRGTQQDIYEFDRIVGSSSALQKVLDIVKKVAKSNTTVLIRGETGTGKELIAGAIHHNSLRNARNFVKVNCAALQENLLESELFGHEKGAFTGALERRPGPLAAPAPRAAEPLPRIETVPEKNLAATDAPPLPPRPAPYSKDAASTEAKTAPLTTGALPPAAWRSDDAPDGPLRPAVADPSDPYQVRAAAVGLHPDLSRALLARLSPADYRNAGIAIKTALAETAEKYLKKGSAVYVEGQSLSRKYKDRDGLERVITERLSPLYVSIHATDPDVRVEMLRNRRGATSLRWLRALLDHGIDGVVRGVPLAEAEALRQQAIRRGWITGCEADRLHFVAAAMHARRIGSVPCALFVAIVRDQRWERITDGDEDEARALLRQHDPRPGRRPVAPRWGLSDDACVVRFVLQTLWQAGSAADPFTVVVQRDATWTQARWDAARTEVQGRRGRAGLERLGEVLEE